MQIVSSSYTAAAYLSSIGFGQSLQPGKQVLLLGSQGTADELAAAGLAVLDAEQLQLPVLDSVDAMLQMQVKRGCHTANLVGCGPWRLQSCYDTHPAAAMTNSPALQAAVQACDCMQVLYGCQCWASGAACHPARDLPPAYTW
jgi:hypothetical protein